MAMMSPDQRDASTAALIRRLWREHIRVYRGRIVLIVVMTLVMSGTTALYPALIDWAFNMFARKDSRILYQVPILVLVVTVVMQMSVDLCPLVWLSVEHQMMVDNK